MTAAQEFPSPPAMSRNAVASLILGIVSCSVPLVLAVPAALFSLLQLAPVLGWHAVQLIAALAGTIAGFIGLREIGRSRGRRRGRWLAWTGIGINLLATLVIMPGVLFGVVFPIVFETRKQKQTMANFHMIVLAMHNYHDDRSKLPPVVVYSREGKPLYSWRLALLPYVGQEQLFQRFKLDEAWDGPTNTALLARMPKVYAPPGESFPPADYATNYLVFDGPQAVFHSGESLKWINDRVFRSNLAGMQVFPKRAGEQEVYDFSRFAGIRMIQDGLSNTILLVEADKRVPWTKPEDLPYAADQPLPTLGGHYRGDFMVAMADGAVRVVSKKTSEKTLRAAITPNGGEILGPDWDAK